MRNYLIKQFANILTIINLSMGLFSIFFAVQGKYEMSLLFIFLAGLSDVFDGLVARKLHITSEIGKYLDSNSDLISFGVAPALLLYLSVLYQYSFVGMLVALIFVICSSIRLAKFNSVVFDGYYRGIPTTIVGPLFGSSFLLRYLIPPYLFIAITLIFSYVMVANFRIKKYH